MKLKEFSLWGFKLPLEESREFTLFNRSICAHFERHFEAFDTKGVYRVIIKLSEPDERVNTIEESSSVLKFYKAFDFDELSSLDRQAKKERLLNVLYHSLLELCEKLSWPSKPFKQAYDAVYQDKFVNIYDFKKKNSRNRKLIAKLECHHGTESFDCYVKVEDKSGSEILKKLVFSSEPDEFIFNSLLGDLKWVDDETLSILRKNRSEIERVRLDLK